MSAYTPNQIETMTSAIKHGGLYIVPAAHFCAGLGFYVSDDPDSVPAWDERGYPELVGPFDRIADAKAAIDAECV